MDPEVLKHQFIAKGDKRVSMELYPTGDGGFVIEHTSAADFDNRRTRIIAKPDGYTTIYFDRFTMMPQYHFQFVVNHENDIKPLADKILSQGKFDNDSAMKLSQQIERTVESCKKHKLGKTLHASGGWVECYRDYVRSCEERERREGRGK